MSKITKNDSSAQEIEFFNAYLAAGHGRGRLNSAGTVYDGKVGYFCVTSIWVEGERQDSILFACMPHDDIVVTAFPPIPKVW